MKPHGVPLLTATAAAVGLVTSVAAEPQRLIIDTDMSSDCDDVGAVCMAHALMDAGEADLLAVVHNTGLPEGVGAVSALNAWYGREDAIPVGAYKGPFDATWPSLYVHDVVQHSTARVKNYSQVPGAVEVYRRALAAAPNASVVISSIGFTWNLDALLQSPPDDLSPMSGRELVEAKVQRLLWMGGRYPASTSPYPGVATWPPGVPEHNFGFHNVSVSTNRTLAAWPAETVPIAFLGFGPGYQVVTGGSMTSQTPEANPCRRAYIDHDGPGNDRNSWDPVTTLYAIRGAAAMEGVLQPYGQGGRNTVQPNDGTNAWVDGAAGGRQEVYLELVGDRNASAAAIKQTIDGLLTRPPKLQVV